MTKLFPFLFVAILAFPLTNKAQTHEVEVNVNLPQYLICGDSYYTSNFSGLKSLMYDLKVADEETYVKLLPAFQELEQQRKTALYLGGSGVIVGTTLTAIGLNSIWNSSQADYSNYSQEISTNNSGRGVAVAGGVVFLAGAIAIAALLPGESEYFSFINAHNQINKNNKIEWKIGLTPFSNNGLGLSVKMKM